MPASTDTEIESLLEVSARIGGDPLLVQAATGNTSIKLDGVLWIKASGKWLAHAAQDDIFIPVNLEATLRRIEQSCDPAGQSAIVNGKPLGTSVETAMHAVLPHRVVFHVHSVNTIAWAVREDGPAALKSRLEGLDWQWIPYVPSGLPLAHAIQEALRRAPKTDVLILANHGLVVCGEDCDAAEALLREVELRVAAPFRQAPEPDWELLAGLERCEGWRVPQSRTTHAPGADPISRRTVSGGVLYPCQAIFLTPHATVCPKENADISGVDVSKEDPFVLIEDAGVLVRRNLSVTQSATLRGLAQVLQRIPESAPIRYLRASDVKDLLCAGVYHYRDVVEDNGAARR